MTLRFSNTIGLLFFAGFLLSSPATAAPLCAKCNIVLIAIDALQARHIHHLGYKTETTPHLDLLAKRSFIFTQAISPSSWTVPTYLSLFTSMYPSAHGLTNRYEIYTKNDRRLYDFTKHNPEIQTLAQILRDHGYSTAGFTGDAGVSSNLGYGKGFDIFFDSMPFGGFDLTTKNALDWIDLQKTKPFFAFVHGYDTHSQFELPDNYQGKFFSSKEMAAHFVNKKKQMDLRDQNLKSGLKSKSHEISSEQKKIWNAWYDSKIFDADARIGKFVQALAARVPGKNTVIVIVSDHGTEFFEHGTVDHGHSLYDELLHVPFMIALPDKKAETRIMKQVGTIDLMPTILEVVGHNPSATLKKQIQGQSLVPSMLGKPFAGEDVFSETDYRNHTHKRSLRTADGWKYILTLETGKEELYYLSQDPDERTNLATENATQLPKLRRQLLKHISSMPARGAQNSKDCLPAYPGPGECE